MIRPTLVVLISALLVGLSGTVRTGPPANQEKPPSLDQMKPVTFKDDISPLLKANCTPCHFKGGKVYGKLPFDNYETVRKLGRKLNTRLQDEKADLVTRWIKGGSIREGSQKENKPQ